MSGCVSCTDSLDQSLTKVPFDTSTGVFDCAGSRKSGQHLRPSVLCGRHERCTTLGAFFFVGRFVCVRVGGIVALLIFTVLAQSSPHFVRVISRCGGALILISLAQPALCIGESFPKGPLHNDPMSSLKSSCTCGFF